MVRVFATCVILNYITIVALAQSCIPVDFGMGSIVCQCNSTYCDFYPDPHPPKQGEFIWYVTSKSGKRLNRNDGKISKTPFKHDIVVAIDPGEKYQTMLGFGGAFTDAACINIKNMSEGCQDNILRSYFDKKGIKYNFGRIPIAGSDFSTRGYSYDDVENDTLLKHFSLTVEDTKYKIPIIKKALKLNPALRFVAAAWSAPYWMKSSEKYNGFGYLYKKYYQAYAEYTVMFLEAYKNNGIEIWAVSTGNEPAASVTPVNYINSMFWSTGTVATWLSENLIPTLAKSTSNETLILALDDQRFNLPWYMFSLNDIAPEVTKRISGIAVHWYFDKCIPATVLDATHGAFPEKFMLLTESSLGYEKWDFPKIQLGSWNRVEYFISKIFENINHWITGWIDWNLVLNMKGGPTWTNTKIDATILVNPEKDIFYKQPAFYALAHFSKFVPRGSIRIKSKSEDKFILSTAFKINEKQTVVVLYNQYNMKKNISILDNRVGIINLELPEKSLHTILY